MKKYKKLILYFIVTFTILLIINLVQIYVNINKYEAQNLLNRKSELQIIVTDMKKVSDSIYDNLINTNAVINIFKDANTTNADEKQKVRNDLYNLLKNNYETFTNYDIQQLHFHLPNNESFLRFHRPLKYGDNLTDIRGSVKYVNETKKQAIGFEEGKIFNGYRFVYPLFDENSLHIGSVEVSSSLLNFKKTYENQRDLQIDYILKKRYIEKKLFKDQLSNYSSYPLSDTFLIQKTLLEYNEEHMHVKERNQILKSLSTDKSIIKRMDKIEEFYIFHFENSQLYTVDFIPLYNDFTLEKVGYAIIVAKSDYFKYMLSSYIMTLFVILFLSVLVGYFFYTKDREKELSKRRFLEYKAILNIYENMVLVVSDCNIIKMNNKFMDFYKPKQSTEVLDINEVIKYDDDSLCMNEIALTDKLMQTSQESIEVSITSRDNIRKYFNIFVQKLPFDDKNKYIIELKDITQHKKETQDLEKKALFDNLTNIYNRHYFENKIQNSFLEIQTSNKPLCIIFFDIDHFKVINDKYGHIVGDESLKFLSQLIKVNTREDDVFSRWGGEEFIILINNSLENSVKVAEYLRSKIESETQESTTIPAFTCSFGVVLLNDFKTIKEALNEADRLLYESKTKGRNIVSF